jgi:hypothetical protein
MPGSELEQVDGAVAGGWIASGLRDGFGGFVKQQVPQVYEAYARVLHPAWDDEHDEVTWAEVARRLGTRAHSEMQWHAIVGSYDSSNFTGSRWPGGDPAMGELPAEKLDALCAVLAGHTGTPESVYFGISTIKGGVAEEWPDAAQLEGLRREWVVLKGPLAAVDQIALSSRHGMSFGFAVYADGRREALSGDEMPERLGREAPNLIWPEDRAWFVAVDVDLDSTLVGGCRQLIDRLLAAPELDVWEVDGEVSLQADADKLNQVPDPPPGWGEPQDPEVLTRNFVAERLGMLAGTVTAAATDPGGVLTVEVDGGRAPGWRLSGAHSSWPQQDVARLVGKGVEVVELDPDTDALRCRFADGAELEVVPLPSRGEEDPPSWQVLTPLGMTLRHGPDLGIEFPQEP